MFKPLLWLVLFFSLIGKCFGQCTFSPNQANNWYFGDRAGTSFASGSPVAVTNGVLNTTEGSSAISDASGGLLCYTNSVTVWNRNHAVMANGAGLLGNISTTQTIIVPGPGSSTLLYIFTMAAQGGADGLRYSVVDMTLDGGLGAVTVKNVPLFGPVTEKITAVLASDGCDIWVVAHGYGPASGGSFLAYRVSSSGVNPVPVVSTVGSVHQSNGNDLNFVNKSTQGQMKISPDGRRLALAQTLDGGVELFDFNDATGVVSNGQVLLTREEQYGIEFSPNGTRLYTSNWSNAPVVEQFDLLAGNIPASRTVVFTPTTHVVAPMQLGPDGKIYTCQGVLLAASTFQGVINNPNALGTACGYVQSAVPLAGRSNLGGISNFVASAFVPASFATAATTNCLTASFTASTSLTSATYAWNFGEPASGAANTSTVANPTHDYAAAGTYTVTLTITKGCFCKTVTQTVTVTGAAATGGGSIGASQNLCAGSPAPTAAPLTSGSGASGGNGPGSYSYQWESSPDNTNWTPIAGATALDYAPGAVAATTYYRRQVTSGTGPCAQASSNVVVVTVAPPTAPGSIGADQTVCPAVAPAPLTSGSGAGGGTGSYAYQWESSPDNTNWTSIAGATGTSYAPGAVAATTYYRRQVTSGTGPCATAATNVVTITVTPGTTPGSIGASQGLCAGSPAPTAAPLTSVSGAGGGTGSYAYQWESSPDGNTWTSIAGATSPGYAPGVVAATTYYRRQVSSGLGSCAQATSNVVVVTVAPSTTPGSVGADQTVCPYATPAPLTSVSGAGGGTGSYAYQWESSPDNVSWTPIAGATSPDYAPSGGAGLIYYRRWVSSGTSSCAVAYSNTVTITPAVPTTPGSIGSNQINVCGGTVPAPLTSVSGAGGGTGSYAYQWESSPDNTNWTPIAGATGTSYAPVLLTAPSTYYRRRVSSGTGACAVSYSNFVLISVTTVTPGSVGADQTLCAASTAPAALTSVSAAGGGNGVFYAYQWQSSPDGVSWTDIAGATATGYAPGVLAATTYYRRQVISNNCPAYSNVVTITVGPGAAPGSIGADQSLCVGATPAPLAGAGGAGPYQWQVSPDGSTWAAIAGATSADYAPGALTATTYYRRQAAAGACGGAAAYSNVVTITVAPAPAPGTIAADQTLCVGTTPAPLTGAGAAGISYAWESSPDGTSWTPIAGATGADYAPGPLTATTSYRRKATAGTCAAAYSNEVTVTVTSAVAGGSIAGPPPVCAGTPPGTLTSTSGTGPYQWETSPDNLVWTAVPGATSATYTPGPLTAITYYRRLTTAGAGNCAAAYSNVVTITVTPGTAPGSIAGDQPICAGTVPAPLTGTGGTAPYQWELSPDGNTWAVIPGATAADYAPGPLTATTYYRRQVNSGTGPCAAAYSNVVTITVTPAPVAGSIAGDQSVCAGTAPAPLTSVSGAGPYQWESSPDGSSSTWAPIAGATAAGYAPGPLTATTHFRRQTTAGAGGCAVAYSNPVVVTVGAAPAPVIRVTGPVPFCAGGQVKLGAGGPPGALFTWLSGGTVLNGAGAVLNDSVYYATAAGSYSVRVELAGCTATSAPVAITTTPVIIGGTIRADTTVCAGTAPNRLTSVSAPGSYSYQWESSLDGSAWAPIAGATGADYAPGPLTATTYYRRQATSGTSTCAAYSNPITITVTPALTPGSIAGPPTVCPGSVPDELTSVSGPGGGTGSYDYQWESSPDGSAWALIAGATSATYVPGPLTATTYYRRRATPRTGGCAAVYSNVVVIRVAAPSVPIIRVAGPVAFCVGERVKLSAGAYPGYLFTWSSGGTVVNGTGAVLNDSVYYATAAGSYTVQIQLGQCASSSPPVALTVVAGTVAGTIGAAQTVCAGAPVAPLTSAISPSGGTGSYLYQWESSSDDRAWALVTGATLNTYTPGPLTATTYYRLRVTSGTGSCAVATTGSVAVTVTAPLVAGVSLAAPPPACAGTPLTFTPVPTNGGAAPTYQWSVNGAPVAGGSTYSSAALANGDRVQVRLTPSADACVTGTPTATVVVQLSPAETPAVTIQAQAAGPSCAGRPVAFAVATATGTGPAPQYQWQLNGADVPGATAATLSLPTARSGDRVRVRLTSSLACATAASVLSNELTVDLRPDPAPAVVVAPPAPACQGDAVRLRRQSQANAGANPTYQWLVNGTALAGAVDSVLTLTAPQDGQLVTLELRTTTACGQAVTVRSAAVRVSVVARVDVDAGPNKEIVAGESVRLDGRANGPYAVTWTPAAGLDFSGGNPLQPRVSPTQTTTYTLRGQVSAGCSDESQVTVVVRPALRIPNAISPNGDGRNDTWEIDGIGEYPGNTVTVFNRWGGQVFRATGYNRGKEWNGKVSGQDAGVGTYYYVITLGNGKSYSGPLTVVY
ncbi:gliding motility-associated C-terminal domain-containing protein [Hymenobacter sp.]|uniref:T9SS type B sorting domain-containing protein n=1 Tax=Hymenobacter sp. TaxID=1898978 RepID=UPI00286A47EF|nr:gliding motility-associated C-terminal domain-containing protein [Hymenobacter sp.]